MPGLYIILCSMTVFKAKIKIFDLTGKSDSRFHHTTAYSTVIWKTKNIFPIKFARLISGAHCSFFSQTAQYNRPENFGILARL
uniref:Uncharacterized protein n=1 Tax=Anguilla anguilla TaxID=7936 RepID=A0A0E9QK82_ANGAN